MNRKHTIEEYLQLIENIKKINPTTKFSSDFIIGYPGETESDFKLSLKLVKKVEFINTYSFVYSPRPGTPAANLKKVDSIIAKERLVIFQKLANEIKLKYKKNLNNKESLVLFENKINNSTNEYFGRDEFNNSVIVKSKYNLLGKVMKTKIIKSNQNTLFGEIIENKEKKEFAA